MTVVLNPFIQEIEDRKSRELSSLNQSLEDKRKEIQTLLADSIKAIDEKYSMEATAKAQREYARIKESARLNAKKIIFDSINQNMEVAFEALRNELRNYVKKAEYKKTLEKMIESAKKELGNNIDARCRKEDVDFLTKQGVSVAGDLHTIGGILVTDSKKLKEIDFTFEELLVIHEDEIKEFILETAIK
jgi:vacuolar-type H+-ATPase subunit E/Vma4